MDSQHDSCVLIVADRVVVRADAGPLEAELALFHPDQIELRTTEPSAIREAGYRTTASEASGRLTELGITAELAEAVAEVVRPRLAVRYARGTVVRRAVRALGAAEMFEGKTYLSGARAYEGQWLNLAALQFDVGDADLSRALQAFHLAALLAEVPPDADVYLSTLVLTQNQRPGVRTYKRIAFGDVGKWPEKLASMGSGTSSSREAGPTRVEVLDWLSARAASGQGGARERAQRIERAIATSTPATGMPAIVPSLSRPPPARGPLSDPVAWAIEAQLDAGEANAALARIDMMERDRGSSPCVVYLRSRASLILKNEDPRVIAERVSMLAANSSFDELELLAAQAWAAAGHMSRALPYARVLAANPNASQELRVRARHLVDVAESSRPPEVVPRQRTHAPAPARGPSGKRTTGAVPSDSPRAALRSRRPVQEPEPAKATQEESGVMRRASPLPAVLAVGSAAGPPTPRVPDTPVELAPETAKADQRQIATLPPPSPHEEHTFAKGISRPAFRAVTTNSTPPQLALGKLELAEAFDDPPAPATLADARVRSTYDARLQCTAMARELGMLYRTQHGIELRTDVASLEAIQAELAARYHETGIRTVSAMLDLRRHGAFLSEMIARSLRATWLDVNSKELGHWTMFVPPDTRIWPFARVLRFVTMGSKERDLVAYFLELHARSC